MKTLFISRDVNESDALRQFCATNKIQLIAISMIAFEPILATDFPPTDVVFFTSPRSVQYYLEQTTIFDNQRIATVGSRTTEMLELAGFKVDFTGKTPTHPQLIAQEFKKWLGSRTVLFPQSNKSNQTMQKLLDTKQYHNRVVYKTICEPKKIEPTPDILLFSSPSNAEAYLMVNTITNQQSVFSFGTTTAQYLNSRGVASQLLNGYSGEDVINTVLRKKID